MREETLTIPNCPECGAAHRYSLQVKRALIIKWLGMSGSTEQPHSVRFTRLFTCPTKNQDFQATFTLTDTSSDRIEDVTVVGPADDEQD